MLLHLFDNINFSIIRIMEMKNISEDIPKGVPL